MNAALTETERRLVELAVADAPELSADQIVDLRRVLKPHLPVRAVSKLPANPAPRRTAA